MGIPSSGDMDQWVEADADMKQHRVPFCDGEGELLDCFLPLKY